jgi:hypothetical protein
MLLRERLEGETIDENESDVIRSSYPDAAADDLFNLDVGAKRCECSRDADD